MSKSKIKPPAEAANSPADSARLRGTHSAAADDTPSSAAPPDLQNTMLGEFRLLRRLGKGGMAEVYLAEQTSLKRNVAIKILRKDLVTDETYLKRFKTEAMAAGGLSHPNIVQVYAIGEEQGIHYIVQEYVQGQNLREFLARKGPPDIAVAIHLMKQAAAALQAAGEAGVVHRDVKPENLMITRKGEVKIADFGLAQLTQGGERVNLTQVGITMGTPLYMSPEQVNGSKLDQRSDIYSLGVTFYHMLSGTPPFRGETALSVALQHLKHEPEPLETVRRDVPAALSKVVQKMMAKDRDARYQNAHAVLKDLKRVAAERSGVADNATDDTASTSDFPVYNAPSEANPSFVSGLFTVAVKSADRPVRRQVFAFVCAALLIAGVAAGAGWMTRTPDPFAAPLPSTTQVPRKSSSQLQFIYATELATDEAAWKAVGEYFPESVLDRDRADQNLAILYLGQKRYDEAMTLFNRFATRSEREYRAFGLGGQMIVYTFGRHDYHRSAKIWADSLQDLTRQLRPNEFNATMQRWVRDAYERNQRELNLQEQYQNLFKEPPPETSDAETKRPE